MSVTQFWILANDVFPPRRIKALVGSFVKAGLLGGIAGSLAASSLAKPLGTVNLLLVTAAGARGGGRDRGCRSCPVRPRLRSGRRAATSRRPAKRPAI